MPFEREAKTVSSLNHPHICTLYDVGREGDTDFLVMELIEGETLTRHGDDLEVGEPTLMFRCPPDIVNTEVTHDGQRFLVTAPAPGVQVGSSRVDLQACKLEYSIVSPK